jgi:hypothetical protein
MRSIAAIRVLLVTGARPGEITPAVISPEFRLGPDGSELHFCDLDARFPTLLLMGHAGLKITDTVYLKRIAPSLSASAQKVGAYIWSLLNQPEAEADSIAG